MEYILKIITGIRKMYLQSCTRKQQKWIELSARGSHADQYDVINEINYDLNATVTTEIAHLESV